jgi:hypothetical protein
MLVNYAAAHWPVDPTRLDLVDEFRRKPRGPHSDALQKLLHRMRCSRSRREFGLYRREVLHLATGFAAFWTKRPCEV